MGRFKHLVDSPIGMEGFRAKYHIPQGVGLQYCHSNHVLTNKEVGEVVVPMIVFIEGGMTLPMGRITRDYLLNHRLCPHQCAPNMFRVLGSVDVLNDQMNLQQMNILIKETFINNNTFSSCLHSKGVVLHAHLSLLENMLLYQLPR